VIRCPNCDAENPPEATHCHHCGHDLAPAVDEPNRELADAGHEQPDRELADLGHEQPDRDDADLAMVHGAERPEADEDLDATLATFPTADTAAMAPELDPSPPVGAPVAEREEPNGLQEPSDQVVSTSPQRGGEAVESASLIGEEDLPAWLRAWDATEGSSTRAQAADTDMPSWMVGIESEQEETAPASRGGHGPSDELAAPVQQAPAPAVRQRSRGEAVFAQVAENEAAVDAAARERVSTWRPPVEPVAGPADRGAPQLPPRPTSARSRRQQPQASPLALVAVIAAALFFLFSLIFFLMNVVF
jgi:hypothetical protein